MSRRWAWPRSWWSRSSRGSRRSTSRAPRSSWSSRTPRWPCRSPTVATSSGAGRSSWQTRPRRCATARRCRRPTWAGEVRLPLIDADELARLLPMRAAIDALERAFAEPELPEAPQRTVVAVAAGELLLMPAAGSAGVGVKLVTLAPDNRGRGLPFVQAAYVLFDPDTLSPRAVLDGTALTNLRTAAVSGVATRHLAGPGASGLVIFGAGATATAHLDAMVAVRPIRSLGVVSRSRGPAEALAARGRDRGLEAAVAGAEAVAEADVVCTCTTSERPVFDGGLLAPGAHVNAIGAYRPDMRELDDVECQRSAPQRPVVDPTGPGAVRVVDQDQARAVHEVVAAAPERRGGMVHAEAALPKRQHGLAAVEAVRCASAAGDRVASGRGVAPVPSVDRRLRQRGDRGHERIRLPAGRLAPQVGVAGGARSARRIRGGPGGARRHQPGQRQRHGRSGHVMIEARSHRHWNARCVAGSSPRCRRTEPPTSAAPRLDGPPRPRLGSLARVEEGGVVAACTLAGPSGGGRARRRGVPQRRPRGDRGGGGRRAAGHRVVPGRAHRRLPLASDPRLSGRPDADRRAQRRRGLPSRGHPGQGRHPGGPRRRPRRRRGGGGRSADGRGDRPGVLRRVRGLR